MTVHADHPQLSHKAQREVLEIQRIAKELCDYVRKMLGGDRGSVARNGR